MIYYRKPMHKQGAFAGTDSVKTDCPVTERLCRTRRVPPQTAVRMLLEGEGWPEEDEDDG